MNTLSERTPHMLEKMHDPFRKSRAPLLTALFDAIARGILRVNLEALSRSLYLDSSRGRWLTEYADLYVYKKKVLESEVQLIARIKSQTLLERMKTTQVALKAQLESELGVSVTLELGVNRTARFDQTFLRVQDAGREAGARMLDRSHITEDGTVRFYQTPIVNRASAARPPRSPGFGPGGVLIWINAPYSLALEDTVLAVLERHIAAFSGFRVGWSLPYFEAIESGLLVFEEPFAAPTGWGVDKWGDSPWG